MYKFLFGIFLLGFGTLTGGNGIGAMGGAIGIPGIAIAIFGEYFGKLTLNDRSKGQTKKHLESRKSWTKCLMSFQVAA